MKNREFAIRMMRLALIILEELEESSPETPASPKVPKAQNLWSTHTPRAPKKRKPKTWKRKSAGIAWTPDEDKLVMLGKNRIKGRTKPAIYTRRGNLLKSIKKGN